MSRYDPFPGISVKDRDNSIAVARAAFDAFKRAEEVTHPKMVHERVQTRFEDLLICLRHFAAAEGLDYTDIDAIAADVFAEEYTNRRPS